MPAKRKRNLFDPNSSGPYPLSRSKVECWLKCPRCFWLRCFWLDRRLGIKPPGLPSMTLNRAVTKQRGAVLDLRLFVTCQRRRVPLSRGYRRGGCSRRMQADA